MLSAQKLENLQRTQDFQIKLGNKKDHKEYDAYYLTYLWKDKNIPRTSD